MYCNSIQFNVNFLPNIFLSQIKNRASNLIILRLAKNSAKCCSSWSSLLLRKFNWIFRISNYLQASCLPLLQISIRIQIQSKLHAQELSLWWYIGAETLSKCVYYELRCGPIGRVKCIVQTHKVSIRWANNSYYYYYLQIIQIITQIIIRIMQLQFEPLKSNAIRYCNRIWSN